MARQTATVSVAASATIGLTEARATTSCSGSMATTRSAGARATTGSRAATATTSSTAGGGRQPVRPGRQRHIRVRRRHLGARRHLRYSLWAGPERPGGDPERRGGGYPLPVDEENPSGW